MTNITSTGWFGYVRQRGCTASFYGVNETCAVVSGQPGELTKTFTITGLSDIQVHWDLSVSARTCYVFYQYNTDAAPIKIAKHWNYGPYFDRFSLLPNPGTATTLNVTFRAGSGSDWAQCFMRNFFITSHSESPTNIPTATPTVTPTEIPTTNPTLNPTYNPTATPTVYPTLHPTLYPTANPSSHPTPMPTVDPDIIGYISSSASCHNLYDSHSVEYDLNLSQCTTLCDDSVDCKMFDYFEDFKAINDSRCYMFNDLCQVQFDPNYNSVIGYKQYQRECTNYPHDWVDNTLDSCIYYESHNWCSDGVALKDESYFDELIDIKYAFTAVDACCACGGGIIIFDKIGMRIDNDRIDYDNGVVCDFTHSDFTLQLVANYFQSQITLRSYDNLILYNLCDELLDTDCNHLIDTQFESPNYNHSLFICNTDDNVNDSQITFIFDILINEAQQTHETFINSLWFTLDTQYYSSFINIKFQNYTQCANRIVTADEDTFNETYRYGVNACYVLDTLSPTSDPTMIPSYQPTMNPSFDPTANPTNIPTINPTSVPTVNPTINPTFNPTNIPSYYPTINPTNIPSYNPTRNPSFDPTTSPTTTKPTVFPSILTSEVLITATTHIISQDQSESMVMNSTFISVTVSLIAVIIVLILIMLYRFIKSKQSIENPDIEIVEGPRNDDMNWTNQGNEMEQINANAPPISYM
eukprot:763600_1